MLHFAVRPAAFTRAARSLNWGISICGVDELEEHLRGDLDVSAGPMAVSRPRDGEVRQQGVELVVRQARDDLPGERDRVDEVDAGQLPGSARAGCE